MTTHTITLYGAKGGSGTSTVAAALAAHIAHADPDAGNVDLIDAATAHDLAAVCGLGHEVEPGRWEEIGPRFELHTVPTAELATVAPWRIIDAGTITDEPRAGGTPAGPNVTYLVARADYLALRRITKAPAHRLAEVAGIILVSEPGRALGRSDVAQVTSLPIIADVPIRAAVARAVDAGVLTVRLPEPLTRMAETVGRDLAHRGYPFPLPTVTTTEGA